MSIHYTLMSILIHRSIIIHYSTIPIMIPLMSIVRVSSLHGTNYIDQVLFIFISELLCIAVTRYGGVLWGGERQRNTLFVRASRTGDASRRVHIGPIVTGKRSPLNSLVCSRVAHIPEQKNQYLSLPEKKRTKKTPNKLPLDPKILCPTFVLLLLQVTKTFAFPACNACEVIAMTFSSMPVGRAVVRFDGCRSRDEGLGVTDMTT